MEIRHFETRDEIERIEGAEFWSSDGFKYWAHDAEGNVICRFTFGNYNTSNADKCKAGGIEVYRDGYAYLGDGELVEAFTAMNATYYREA